ncbi:hypothetical protein PF007_g8759 [Phytophthora fragariae]|uniref:Uncharacterized protein n=1 Tax=Phytophthora fragariae TaxID=53985 RepID=A0A6A3FBD2_9STRA|nr:hypothetical protein PF009_g9038 [Phytophthora fragariae]KAE9118889.1 hypothetical protein PF007_g8759 [Phytophthora fragariae]KAE9356357.1 hypothetical protein PF008_g3653 [Phytophthora fragariae]
MKKKALYGLRHASASNTQHIYGGAGAISSTDKPIASTTIAGTQWSVCKGPNGSMMAYSLVASKQVENFEGDLMEFFNYLAKDQGSQILIKRFVHADAVGRQQLVNRADTTAPAASSTSSSAEQTTPGPADPSTGSVCSR